MLASIILMMPAELSDQTSVFSDSVRFSTAEAAVGQLRILKSEGIHPEDGSLFVEQYEYSTGIRLGAGRVLATRHSVTVDSAVAARIEFWHRGQEHFVQCTPIAQSRTRDLVVLNCPSSRAGSLTLTDIESNPGDQVFVGGYPSYSYPKPRLLLSSGAILETKVSLPGSKLLEERRGLLLLDAPVYEGQSGSAVFDSSVRLIGMVIKARQTTSGNWAGETYAIPGEELARVVSELESLQEAVDPYDFLNE